MGSDTSGSLGNYRVVVEHTNTTSLEQVVMAVVLEGVRKTMKHLGQNSQSPGSGSKWPPSNNKSMALQLQQPVQYDNHKTAFLS
jgi:hypothetical protein